MTTKGKVKADTKRASSSEWGKGVMSIRPEAYAAAREMGIGVEGLQEPLAMGFDDFCRALDALNDLLNPYTPHRFDGESLNVGDLACFLAKYGTPQEHGRVFIKLLPSVVQLHERLKAEDEEKKSTERKSGQADHA